MKPVVIVGAGYTGSLIAAELVERGGPPVLLVERGPSFGRGAAYGTRRPEHLLNVRAANMSAFAGRPDHFVHWLGTDDGAEFAPRLTYGAYLEGIVARAARDPRLELVPAAATAAEPSGDGWRVTVGGRAIDAAALVLALGNFAPVVPPGVDAAGLGAAYVTDPWRTDVAAGLDAGDTVLMIGTGLTMVDTALTLDALGFAGRMVAVSRRGLVPERHEFPLVPGPPAPCPRGCPATLLAALRARSSAIGWRPAVDEWRPHVQTMWRGWSEGERRRFLRHARAWWDVRRHRVASRVAERIAALRDEGRLSVHAGRLRGVGPAPGGARAAWRGRDGGEVVVEAARVVNCTGPGFDVRRAGEPLVDSLLARGALRPDPLGLGIDTDADGRVLGAGGAVPGLYAAGPMTRGALWEIVAVPHIREQAAALARRLAALA